MAAAEFERLVRDFPESRSACDAEFALAECYWHQSRKPQYDQRETEQAIVQLSRYLERCPEHEGAAEADELIDKALDRLAEKRYRAAKLYAKLKRPDAALLYCDLLVSEFGDSRWVCDARRLKAELLVNLTRFVEARAEIQWLEQNCADSEGLSGEIEALEQEMADAEAERS
jgi:outer membrane protein assembly factor BamD (BamD/ComL family)